MDKGVDQGVAMWLIGNSPLPSQHTCTHTHTHFESHPIHPIAVIMYMSAIIFTASAFDVYGILITKKQSSLRYWTL